MPNIRYMDHNGRTVTQRENGSLVQPRTVKYECRSHDAHAIVRLRRQGYSYGLIRRRFECSNNTIAQAIKRLAPELLGLEAKYRVQIYD